MGLPVTKLYDFYSCVYDNASVNTGSIGGVGELFKKARLAAWLVVNNRGGGQ